MQHPSPADIARFFREERLEPLRKKEEEKKAIIARYVQARRTPSRPKVSVVLLLAI